MKNINNNILFFRNYVYKFAREYFLQLVFEGANESTILEKNLAQR